MGSRAENVSQRLRRSTSRGRSESAGRSPNHRRSKSPARGKAASEKRQDTPPRGAPGPKSLPKTPQISPSRQSMRLVEKALHMSLPEQLENKPWGKDAESFMPRQVIDLSGDYEPHVVPEKPEKVQVVRPEPLQPREEPSRNSKGGGILGLALMALLPAVALAVGLGCSPKLCNFLQSPEIPRNVSAYLDVEVAGVFLGWLAFQFIVALIPVGFIRLGQPLQPGGKRLKYRCNGLFALVVNGLAIGLLTYYKYPVYNWLSQKFLPLTVTASLYALLFGIVAFLRARRLPKEQLSYFGQSGNVFNDVYVGRQLNPRIAGVDLKLFFIVNVGLIGWATLESFTLVEAFQKDQWTGYMVLVAVFHGIYLLDALIFQGSFATTATATNDGFGFKIAFASLAWQPMVSSVLVRYLLLHQRAFCMCMALSSTVLFLIGYMIYRCSSYEKDVFRMRRHDHAFAAWSRISSSTGRPLLCTFWWRKCRHPNYLGHLLMVIAWSLPCGLDCPLSYAFPLVMLLAIVGRIREVEAVCHENHGTAWNRYTHKVKSRLIPRIY